MVRVIAMLAMLIDHIGFVFFPEVPVFRYIGRIAMPLFAYGIALGMWRTHDRNRYILRLAIFTAVSQVPFMLMTGYQTLCFNIGLPWLIAAVAIEVWERFGKGLALSFGLWVLIYALGTAIPMDYGWLAVALVMVFYLNMDDTVYAGMACLLLVVVYISGSPGSWMQICCLLGVVLALIDRRKPLPDIRLPRWLVYGFYPIHMLVLWVIYGITH